MSFRSQQAITESCYQNTKMPLFAVSKAQFFLLLFHSVRFLVRLFNVNFCKLAAGTRSFKIENHFVSTMNTRKNQYSHIKYILTIIFVSYPLSMAYCMCVKFNLSHCRVYMLPSCLMRLSRTNWISIEIKEKNDRISPRNLCHLSVVCQIVLRNGI